MELDAEEISIMIRKENMIILVSESISTIMDVIGGENIKGEIMIKYIVIENTPGYMPESAPVSFRSFPLAQEYMNGLIEELIESEYYIVQKLEDYAYLERNANDLGRVIEIIPED